MKFLKRSRLCIFLFVFMIISIAGFAQQAAQVNYQGIARKADGSPVSEQAISLRLSIHDGGAASAVVYTETRTLTTNKFGLFTTVIGSAGANSQTGSMSAVAWSTGNKFLQVELDPEGGNNFQNLGTSQLQSVPYAIYASQALPSGNANGDLGGTYPNPTVSKIQGSPVSTIAPQNGQVLKWNGTSWAPADATGSSGPSLTVTANTPLNVNTNGSNASISLDKAGTGTDGYLSRTDWLIFNDKASKDYVDAAAGSLSDAISAEKNRALAAESLKESTENKSTDLAADAASDLKYPTVRSVKTYVDASISPPTPDADAGTKGKIQLAGDLSGTAAAPVIGNGKITDAKIAAGINPLKVGLGNVDNTSDANKPVSNATRTALDLKAPLASPTFTGIVSGVTKEMVGLSNADNTSDSDKPVSTATQTALDLKASAADLASKAPLASPAFTGTVSGITKEMVGLSNADNTSDADKPVSTATQTALDLKASAADIALKAPLESPAFTGTVSGITKSMVGLGNVDNTSDAAKPVSTATQTALDLKADLASPTFTGTPTLPAGTIATTQTAGNSTTAIATTAFVTGAIADGTPDADAGTKGKIQLAGELSGTAASPAITNAAVIGKVLTGYTSGTGTVAATDNILQAIQKIDGNDALKAPLASPTFTGTVSGITKTMVGLGNVDNTTDVAKPVSTATQTALDLKANLASPAFTGTPTLPAGTIAATQTAGNSTTAIATTAFVTGAIATATPDANGSTKGKIQLAGELSGTAASPAITNAAVIGKVLTGYTSGAGAVAATDNILQAIQKIDGNDALKAPLASPAFTGTVTGITKAMVGLENVDNTSDAAKPVSTATQTALNLKADQTSISVDGLSDAKNGGTNFSNSLLIGHQTTGTLSSADRNIGIGIGALAALTEGDDNIAVGYQALNSNTTGQQNLAIGRASMAANQTGGSNTAVGLETLESNTTGHHNAAFGHLTMASNTSGNQNAAYGQEALNKNNTGDKNAAVGGESLYENTSGNFNVAVGFGAGGTNTTGSNNTLLGYNSNVSTSALTNATALGNGATVAASNTIQLGNNSVTLVNTSGAITSAGAVTGGSIIKSGGTSSQFLKADGSVDANTYAITASPTFTGTPVAPTATAGTNTTQLATTAFVTAADNLKADLASPTFTGTTTVSESLSGGNTASSTIAGFSANINAQSGTTYTLTSADNGKIITLNNAGAITLTVPALYAGFNCMIVQVGAGQVSFSASGVTISNRNSYTKTAGTNAIATLIALSSTSFISSGDMSN